jgi:hypothetical protein
VIIRSESDIDGSLALVCSGVLMHLWKELDWAGRKAVRKAFVIYAAEGGIQEQKRAEVCCAFSGSQPNGAGDTCADKSPARRGVRASA